MEVLVLYRCVQLGSNFDAGALKKLRWLHEQDGSVPQRSLFRTSGVSTCRTIALIHFSNKFIENLKSCEFIERYVV